ncbi:MAG: hypothetical protein IKO78_03600 [Bacilli bacterium]|nr:hypothetical protein [Bacilli bacterium]
MPRISSRNFKKNTIDIIAKRAAYMCSNPKCNKQTEGPADKKTISIGEAAHINAVSRNGPRYDPSLPDEYISSQENGLWLCRECHKKIDNKNDRRYTVELLKSWKEQRETTAERNLGIPRPTIEPSNYSYNEIVDNENIKSNDDSIILTNNYKQITKELLSNLNGVDGELANYIFNDKTKEYESDLNNSLSSIIKWFVGQRDFPVKDINTVYDYFNAEKIKVNKRVLSSRRNALINYFTGNIDSSKNIYSRLYNIINKKDYKVDDWIYDDYLVDGRLIIDIFGKVNKKYYDNKYAIQLSMQKHYVFYPYIDKIEKDIFNSSFNNTIKYKYKRRNTYYYGMGLEGIFNDIQRAVFITIIYGSIANLLNIRNMMSKVLMIYADRLDDDELYEWALLFYVMCGNYDNYKLILEKVSCKYRGLESESFISRVLNLRSSITKYTENNFDIFIYDTFGRYLDDKKYDIYERRILKLLNSNYVPVVNSTIKSLYSNIPRFKRKDKLLEFLNKYVKKGGYRQVQEVIKYLNYNELGGINKNLLKEIIKKIIDSKDYLIITNLLVEIKKIEKINDYDEILLKENTDDNLIYELNKDNKFTSRKLQLIVDELSKRIEDNIITGAVTSYSTNYKILPNFFDRSNSSKDRIITENIFPLCEKCLSSNKVEYIEKIKLLRTLMYIFYFDERYSDKIKDIVSKTVKDSNTGMFDEEISDVFIEAYLIFFDYVFGEIDFIEMIRKYIDISNNEYVFEEIGIVLEHVLKKESINIESKEMLILFIQQKINSNISSDRITAIKLTRYLYNTELFDEIYDVLYSRSIDSSYNEMRTIMSVVNELDKRDKKIKAICYNLINNRNYNIKYMGKKYLKQ